MKNKFRELIGRNLARIKIGKEYIALISFMITAMSILSMYLKLTFSLFIILLITFFIIGWLFGYIVDNTKILSAERKGINLANMEVQQIIWSNIIKEVFNPELLPELESTIKEAFKEGIKELEKENLLISKLNLKFF